LIVAVALLPFSVNDPLPPIVHSGATIYSDLVGYPTDGYWTISVVRRGKISPVKQQEISHA
jgi:hypothetical protein